MLSRKNQAKLITNILNSAGFRLELKLETEETYAYFDTYHDICLTFEGSDMYSDPKVVNDLSKAIDGLVNSDVVVVAFPYFMRLHYDLFKFAFEQNSIETLLPFDEIFENDMEIFDHKSLKHGFDESDVLPASFTYNGLKQFENVLCINYTRYAHQVVNSLADIYRKWNYENGLMIYPSADATDPLCSIAFLGVWCMHDEDGNILEDESTEWNEYVLLEMDIDSFEQRYALFMNLIGDEEEDD